ncbi:Cache 3/Cache 2 fusion domain-containing protein [Acidovorax lacteus]|uniref:Methyl-accepting chemotaxis protein n=1 Tax=Acidovorax lacteus TaxID=1924988 RepID=A0ABP8L2J5_9BURK
MDGTYPGEIMFSARSSSIAFKLSLAALLSLCAVLLVVMGVVSALIWSNVASLARSEVQQVAAQVRMLVQAFDETAQEQAKRDFVLFRSVFGGTFERSERPGADGKPEVVLTHQGDVLNGNFEVVDRFTVDSMGGVATIFARTGDDFVRVTTSLKKQDGERAYKTLLDRKHPAYALMLEGKTYIGRATLFGREYMTVYEPIRQGNDIVGILFIGSDIGTVTNKLGAIMGSQKLQGQGAVYAVQLGTGPTRGRLTAGPEASKAPLDEKNPATQAWIQAVESAGASGVVASDWSPLARDQAPLERMLAVERYQPWNWVIVAEVPEAQLTASAGHVLLWLWAGVACSLVLLTLVLTFATRRMIGQPLRTLGDALGQLAQGDLRRPVALNRRDEMGALAQSMEGFRQRLAGSLQTVRRNADSVAAASVEIAQGNQDLSGRTETQASALEQTAASMEQLGSTTQHNAENAAQASQLAAQASAVAVEGGAAVTRMVQTMHEIHTSSQRIADIVGVIDGIAFQTNILALNAAVEAARAGDQGRGFAVVAAEVRNLAQRTAAEAKAIKELIGSSSAKVQQGSELADQTGQSMHKVVESIRKVTDMVSEISAANREQTASVGQVGQAVASIDQTTQQNAALVEEMAAAAGSLRTQAQQMVEAVSFFQLGATATGESDGPLEDQVGPRQAGRVLPALSATERG